MSTVDRRRPLRAEIAKRRAELGATDRQRAMAHDALGRLETELAALDDLGPGDRPNGSGPGSPVPETPAEKVALFRSLFRGRDDVYPKLWTNALTSSGSRRLGVEVTPLRPNRFPSGARGRLMRELTW